MTPKLTSLLIAECLTMVRDFVSGRSDESEFIAGYDGRYDEYALDGHEGADGPQSLELYSRSLAILASVESVMGMLVVGEVNEEQYLAAGRVPVRLLRDRIKEAICDVALLGALEECSTASPASPHRG